MPRNGSGIFSAPATSFPAVTGTLIESAKYNEVINDIGTAISGSIAANGETVVIADIPLNEHKLTGVANGVAADDAMTFGQLQFVSVKDEPFGAIGDGVTDDSTSFTSALAAAGMVFVPAGHYRVSNVTIPANTYLFGEGAASIIQTVTNTDRGVFTTDSGGSSSYVSSVVIENIKFYSDVATSGFSEQDHLMTINGGKDWTIRNCIFQGFRGDGLYIGSSDSGASERHNINITVENCLFDGVNSDNRNGITVIDGDGVRIIGNTFRNCTKSTMPGPIDIEPDAHAYHVVKNIEIAHNRIESFGGGYGIAVYLDSGPYTDKLFGLHIHDNYIAGATKTNAVALRVSTAETISAATLPMNIRIHDNAVDDSGAVGIYPYQIINVRDVHLKGNTYRNGGTQAVLGDVTVAATTVMDAVIEEDNYDRNGNANGALVIASVERLMMRRNIIDQPAAGTSTIGVRFVGSGVTTASNNVTLEDNIFIKGASQTKSFSVLSHTLDTASNISKGNKVIGGTLTDEFTANDAPDYVVDISSLIALAGSSTAGSHTYAIKHASLIRIGKMRVLRFQINLTTKDAAMAGNVRITGLPDTAANVGNQDFVGSVEPNSITFSAGMSQLTCYISPNNNYIQIRQGGSGVADTALPATGLANGSALSGSIVYFV